MASPRNDRRGQKKPKEFKEELLAIDLSLIHIANVMLHPASK